MYFWSVSLVDQLSGQFYIFLIDQFFYWLTKNQFLIFLVDQSFFWSTKNHFLMFLVDQFFFWSTKFIFGQLKKKIGQPKKWEISFWSTKKKLVDQKYVKFTGQLVDQRD